MNDCEYILIGISSAFLAISIGASYAFIRILNTFNREITSLNDQVLILTEKQKKIQIRILSLNEISGLNI